jgi:hypothetical protein
MVVPFLSQSRPAFLPRSPVGIIHPRQVALAAARKIADRFIATARHDLATPDREAEAAPGQVRASGTGAPVVAADGFGFLETRCRGTAVTADRTLQNFRIARIGHCHYSAR